MIGKNEKAAKKSRTAPRVLEPMYALVGATELTAGVLRELGAKGAPEKTGDDKLPALAKLRGDVIHIARGTTRVPGAAVGEVLNRYAELAQRGQETLANAVPVAKKVRSEGEALARAEDARARREARRLARQAGANLDRGKTLATQAAEDAGRRAERTLGVVKQEASQVVDAVSHPGRAPQAVRRPSARRRAAVVDTAVTATSPAGGETEAGKAERTTAGVEAGASTTTRRSPRARKAAATKSAETKPAAGRAPRASATVSGTPDATVSTVVAKSAAKKGATKKATAKKTASKKATSTARTVAAATPTGAATTGPDATTLPAAPAPGSAPTPADIAAAVVTEVATDPKN